jgi:hypothetical protein
VTLQRLCVTPVLCAAANDYRPDHPLMSLTSCNRAQTPLSMLYTTQTAAAGRAGCAAAAGPAAGALAAAGLPGGRGGVE